MFDSLTQKLQRVFKNLRGEGKLTEANMQEALRQIRLALLEADVNFKVVRELLEGIKAKALGRDVLDAFSPTEQVVQIVRDELIRVLGNFESRLRFSNNPPSIYLITGLQGSGKTTSTGKLALWLSKNGHNPLVVSVDIYRPAARQQLSIIAKSLHLPVYEGADGQSPVDLAIGARREATQAGRDVVLVDTAGRLHIDDALMQELEQLRTGLEPVEILYVADAMTGQDAVRSAEEFHKRLEITGIILTKMDGDARGGAALSIRHVTGQPLKFIGIGEKPDALEPFHPSRIANRILGMGDMLSLIEKVEKTIDQKKAVELQQKILDNDFTLEDFRDQLRQLRKLGPLESLMSMLPQAGPFKALQGQQVDPKELTHIEAIINSMTNKERLNHQIINGNRRRRIARGSGTTVQEVNQLLKQYAEVRKMMKSLTSGGSMKRKLAALMMR